MYAADIDEDEAMDVLSASTMDNTIAWYRSVPAGDSQPPHGIIEPVTPDPRIGAVNQVTITFDERVTGFDLSDIRLQRDGRFLSLANLASLETDDGITRLLLGLASLSDRPGVYQLSIGADTSSITDQAGNSLADGVFEQWTDVRQMGDANLDRRYDQLDIVNVLQSAKYLTGQPATWSEGDWTGDGLFDQLDIVAALQSGHYLQGPYAERRESDASLDTPSDVNDANQLLANIEEDSSHVAAFCPGLQTHSAAKPLWAMSTQTGDSIKSICCRSLNPVSTRWESLPPGRKGIGAAPRVTCGSQMQSGTACLIHTTSSPRCEPVTHAVRSNP